MPVQESFNDTLMPLNYVVIHLTLFQPGVPYKVAIGFHKVQNYCLKEKGKQMTSYATIPSGTVASLLLLKIIKRHSCGKLSITK